MAPLASSDRATPILKAVRSPAGWAKLHKRANVYDNSCAERNAHTHTHRRALCIMSSYGGALLSAKHYLKHESKVFSKVFRFEEVIREI